MGPLGFLLGGRALVAHQAAAGAHQGQSQFRQQGSIRHRPGGDQGEAVPQGRVPARVLAPGVKGLGVEAQGPDYFLQKVHPLAQGVDEGHPDLGQGDGQGQAGQARAAAHVGQGVHALEQAGMSQQGEAVQVMAGNRFLVVGVHPGQVHGAPGLGEHLVVSGELLQLPLG